MRLKHIKNAEIDVLKGKYIINNPKDYIGSWNKVFGNNNKIEIEIGMGKGNFIISKALSNPNVNYIGLEKYASVLLFANKKIEEKNIPNLRIIYADAIDIDKMFNKEIHKVYLNFSDPWPKSRHEKRRLTSTPFLKKYKPIFKGINIVEQKTDNEDFFKYSLKSFRKNRFLTVKKSVNYFDKYRTEYEQKFIDKGKNINFVKVIKFF